MNIKDRIKQLKEETIKNILASPGLSIMKRKIMEALAKKKCLK
tara:strand:+ start:42 stop:170 length:129 start_codon:yes stop_codon:yes gene_type:complete